MTSDVLAQILGPDGLIVVAVIAVILLFGGSKIPKLARSLGGASHEFKNAAEEFKHAAEHGERAATAELEPSSASVESAGLDGSVRHREV